MMNSPNLGWLFYKDYFNGIIYDDLKLHNEKKEDFEKRMIKKYRSELEKLKNSKSNKQNYEDQKHCILYKNECLIRNKIQNIINTPIALEDNEQPLGNIHFKATTTYPGLLIGSGYIHELPDIDAQAILGFDFDYTSGLPIIRGSSIKGVIRSAFPLREKELKEKLNDKKLSDTKKKEIEEINKNKKNYIKKFIPAIGDNIDKLIDDIFDNGDTFFDATVVKYGTKLLGDDYITPHGDNPLKNPIPLRFIKVMPNVTFRFDFELSDFKQDKQTILTKEQKAILFGEILSDLGIGAKTNLGYGRFDDKLSKNSIERQLKEHEEERKRAKEEEERQKRLNSLSPLQRKIEEIPLENGSRVAPFLRAIESGEFDDNRKEALEELKKLMIKERVWVEESKAKNPKKDKKHQRTIKVIEMMRDS